MTGGPKLLIEKASATVAEGRQATKGMTRPDNNGKGRKPHAVYECGEKNTIFAAQKKIT